MTILSIKEQKEELRRQVRQKSQALSAHELSLSNRLILQNAVNLPEYRNADTIFCYVGVSPEVETRSLLEDALKHGKQAAVPLCLGQGIMEARQITSLDDLRLVRGKRWEPGEEAPLVEPSQINLSITPGLAFDHAGRRLGQGGGYYDRFFTRCNAVSVALVRKMFILDEIPADSWDFPVKFLITEDAAGSVQF